MSCSIATELKPATRMHRVQFQSAILPGLKGREGGGGGGGQGR